MRVIQFGTPEGYDDRVRARAGIDDDANVTADLDILHSVAIVPPVAKIMETSTI